MKNKYMFRMWHDGVSVFDPGKDFKYMLLFTSGKPSNWKMPKKAVPSEMAARATEDDLKVALGIRDRSRAWHKKMEEKQHRRDHLEAKEKSPSTEGPASHPKESEKRTKDAPDRGSWDV